MKMDQVRKITFKTDLFLNTGDSRLPLLKVLKNSSCYGEVVRDGDHKIVLKLLNTKIELSKKDILIEKRKTLRRSLSTTNLEKAKKSHEMLIPRKQDFEVALSLLLKSVFELYTSVDLKRSTPEAIENQMILMKACRLLSYNLQVALLENWAPGGENEIYMNLQRSSRSLVEWGIQQTRFSDGAIFENMEFLATSYLLDIHLSWLPTPYEPLDEAIAMTQRMNGHDDAKIGILLEVVDRITSRFQLRDETRAKLLLDEAEDIFFTKLSGTIDEKEGQTIRESILEYRLRILQGRKVTITIEARTRDDLLCAILVLAGQGVDAESAYLSPDLGWGARNNETFRANITVRT